jgi:NAD+ synthase (glutamine-hydrolysing)
MRTLRIALAQINTTVGDLDGNTRKILDGIERARAAEADLVTFPELSITGYPPEDLLFKPRFIRANLDCLQTIINTTTGVIAVVGFVDSEDDIYNAAAVIADCQMVGVYRKSYLPNYGVFDENRYFQAGTRAPVFTCNGITVGVTICEDIWYPGGPLNAQALVGNAEIILNISASPYQVGKIMIRERMIATRASDNKVILAYNNLVGGQDELLFDGNSLIIDQDGEIIARGASFEEDFIVADLDAESVFRGRLQDPRRRREKFLSAARDERVDIIPVPFSPRVTTKPALQPHRCDLYDRPREVYTALVLGTGDYVRKNGFKKVLVGLSGGIDSALTATIAVDALGPENVVGVTMPSHYSSEGTQSDAALLAENLGIRLITLPIQGIFETYLTILHDAFEGLPPNIAEENLQARIRGNLLMALSNKFGWLVLTTGNKSEMSVGYATLYGDMAGGFAVIKDIYKTLVYELAAYRNRLGPHPAIPQSIIDREPSAELRPNQRDVDSLPPYPLLDPILQAYVEDDRSRDEIVALGCDEKMVSDVIRMVDRSEYKRRQAPPGIKITPRAFGKDRRLPITNRNTCL